MIALRYLVKLLSLLTGQKRVGGVKAPFFSNRKW